MKHYILQVFGRFLRWFFGSPFRDLASEFGDLLPAELRVFEERIVEMQHHLRSQIPAPTAPRQRLARHKRARSRERP
jgi:hypothetical protein